MGAAISTFQHQYDKTQQQPSNSNLSTAQDLWCYLL